MRAAAQALELVACFCHIARLVKPFAIAIQQLIGTENETLAMPRRDGAGLGFGETRGAVGARAAGLSAFLLDDVFIDIGGIGFGGDPCIREQAFARGAGRGEDQRAHVSSPRDRASSRRIAAAVSSIDRRLTSITGQLRSVKRRRAAVTSSFTLSRSVYSLRSCWCSDASRCVR